MVTAKNVEPYAVSTHGSCSRYRGVQRVDRDRTWTRRRKDEPHQLHEDRIPPFRENRLADFKELGKYWPAEVIEALAKDGANLLRGGAGIGAKDLLSVAKALPAPKGKDEKTIEGFIEQEVRVRIRQDRQKRRKGRQKLDPDDAMKIFVTTSMRLLREARLSDSASQRSWLKKAVGYLMEARAITGTVATERLSIPEGFMPRRGRPRKDKKAA
jgi:hypothetical protein